MSAPKRRGPLPKPIDIQQALEEAIASVSKVTSEYALIGGVARAFYGVERFTKNVDLVVRMQAAVKAAEELKAMDPQPLRIGGTSIQTSSGVRVDLIDRRVDYRSLYEEAIT